MAKLLVCFFGSLLELNENNLPLRIVVRRIGSPSTTEIAHASQPCDSAPLVHAFWTDVVEHRPDHEDDKEHLVVVLLNTKLHPLGYHVVSTGTVNETLGHPREIFRTVVLVAAYAFILVHNHPSGNPAPSQADQRLTRKLVECAVMMEVSFLDHVIIGKSSGGQNPYFSFREAGMM